MGKGQRPSLLAEILLILCVVTEGSSLHNDLKNRLLTEVTTYNHLLYIKRRVVIEQNLEFDFEILRGH